MARKRATDSTNAELVTPVDADVLTVYRSGLTRRYTWAGIKTALTTAFDAQYAPAGAERALNLQRMFANLSTSTWTIRTSAANNNWHSVCWSAELGLFCAVSNTGSGNRVMTSPDGVTWTIRTSAADNGWFSVCWSAELGLFCAVSITGVGNRVMTSRQLVEAT